jgi:hypothetical protein
LPRWEGRDAFNIEIIDQERQQCEKTSAKTGMPRALHFWSDQKQSCRDLLFFGGIKNKVVATCCFF